MVIVTHTTHKAEGSLRQYYGIKGGVCREPRTAKRETQEMTFEHFCVT